MDATITKITTSYVRTNPFSLSLSPLFTIPYLYRGVPAFLTILLHTHFKRLHKFDIQDRFSLLLKYSLVDCELALFSRLPAIYLTKVSLVQDKWVHSIRNKLCQIDTVNT